MKKHLNWHRLLNLLVFVLFIMNGSIVSAETPPSTEAFSVQNAVWEQNEDTYSVRISITNQSGETILDPSACVCFMDASSTIIDTSVVQQHGRLRNNQVLIFTAEIRTDSAPSSVYVDYLQYQDGSACAQTYFFDEPVVLQRVSDLSAESPSEQAAISADSEASLKEENPPAEPEEKPLDLSSSEDENAPKLHLSESSLTLDKGKTASLKTTIINGDSKKASYTWETTDPAVVKVAAGKVTAVDGGKATITCTATLADGSSVSASTIVTVTVPAKLLKLNGSKDFTLEAGKSTRISYELAPENVTVQTLEWISSNPEIAWVDTDGKVTAVSAGKVTITATTQDGSKKKIQASVYVPALVCDVNSVTVDKTEGTDITLKYYGKSWDENVKIEQKGKMIEYSIEKKGSDVTLHLSPVSVGSGTIKIQDKTDKKSEVKIDISVTLAAIPFYRYISLSDVKIDNMHFFFHEHNNTGNSIIDYTIIIKYYDQNGNVIHLKSLKDDVSTFGMSSMILDVMKTNDTVKKECWFDMYYPEEFSHVSHAEFALKSVGFIDGTMLCIREDDYVWYSGKTNQYIVDGNKKQTILYSSISQTEKDRSGSFMLGFYRGSADRETYNHYGFQNIGEIITEVDEDSLFGRAGIQAGDLIISVDEATQEEDYYYIEKAKARMTEGKTAVFRIERPGVAIMEYEFTINGGKLINSYDLSGTASTTTTEETDNKSSSPQYLTEEEYNQYAALFIGIVKSTLKKPDSMEVHWASVMEYNNDLYIVFSYSAMNGFGGYNRDTWSFKFEPGHISLTGNSSDYDMYEKHKNEFYRICSLDLDEVMKKVQ